MKLVAALRWSGKVFVALLLSAIALLAAEFVRPAAPDSPVATPFTGDRGVILISGTINGRGPFDFLVDTGTDPSVLDARVADSTVAFSIPLGGQGSGVGGDAIDVSLLPPVKVGLEGLRPRWLLTLAVDLSPVSARLGRPIHGILGHNFLRRHRLEIDYGRAEIRFLPSSGGWSPARAELVSDSLRFMDGENFPLFPELRFGEKPVRATLDTGSSQMITLYPRATDRLGLGDVRDAGAEASVAGFGGEASVRRGHVHDIRVGPMEFDSVEVSFVRDGSDSASSSSPRDANVGNGLLRAFVVGLDYPGRRVILWAR